MKTASIPATIDITRQPFSGRYVKRPGSRNDKTLYCWFHEDSPDDNPHFSVNINSDQEEWSYFHVTFPMFHMARTQSDNWRARGADTFEQTIKRYHIHLDIGAQTDRVTINNGHSDDPRGWNRPDTGKKFDMSFADIDRQAVNLGQSFYSIAYMSH